MDEVVTWDSVSANDIFPNFGLLELKAFSPKKIAFVLLEIVTVLINCLQDFVSSNSFCYHTRD